MDIEDRFGLAEFERKIIQIDHNEDINKEAGFTLWLMECEKNKIIYQNARAEYDKQFALKRKQLRLEWEAERLRIILMNELYDVL